MKRLDKKEISIELRNILQEKYKNNDINSVNNKMLDIIKLFSRYKEYSNINSFLKTYQIVTSEVIKNSNIFNDFNEMQKLDIIFAQEFFNPLNLYFNNKELKENPWNNYFEYINRKNSIPFLQMLIGINCHINGDLAISLYKAKVKNKEDFETINKILTKVSYKVLINLIIKHKDILSLAAILIPFLPYYEFDKTIVKWRNSSYENYTNLNDKNYKSNVLKMYKQTNQITNELIDLFHTKNPIKIIFILYKLNKIQPRII